MSIENILYTTDDNQLMKNFKEVLKVFYMVKCNIVSI